MNESAAVQESIGDSIYLAMMAPMHLKRLNLITDEQLYPPKDKVDQENFDLYLLMKMALSKIPQISFEYIFDVYRWKLFNGEIRFDQSNEFFWKYLEKYQGIKPPNGQLDRHDLFDIAAKFHLADNTPFSR